MDNLFQINMPNIIIVTTKAILLSSLLVIFLIAFLHAQQTRKMGERLGILLPTFLSRLTSFHMFLVITLLLIFSVIFLF